MRPLAARTWWWLLTAVALGVLAWLDEGQSGWGYSWRAGLLAVGVIAAIVAVRTHSSTLLAIALCAGVLRVGLVQRDVPELPATADAATWAHAITDLVVGGLLIATVLFGLRFRRGSGGPREVLDGLTVAAGAGLTAWITLANPAIDGGMHPGLAVLSTAYLPMAIMLVTFAAELMLEGLARNRAMWLVIAGFFAALGGAIVRALVQAGELHSGWQTTSTGLLVVAIVLLCAAVSHGDSRRILEPLTPAQRATTTANHETVLMAPLIVSLAVPIVLVAMTSPSSHADMVVRGVVTMVLVAVTIARLYVALNANSRAQQALVLRLDRDELTNLPTRSRFLDRVAEVLEDTWRSEHHATLIQINIDRFKNINDTLGHESANRVLVSLAERLRATAEGFGASVARAGGDDFVVIDGSTRTFDDAHERVARMGSVFARPFIVGDATVFVTASIGVAMAPRNRTITAEELLRRADIATHRAKADGRNRVVVFDDSMQSNLAWRMDVEHALHGAIGRQEMRLYHQPIVDLDTGHLSGFEALIRWQRDGVIVPPVDFIPIAEETGIIKEIGAWALREALCELQGWINDGVVAPGTTTSVNVSPRQILDPDFAAVVRDALEYSGVPPHLLWLEMTESMMLDEPDLAESTLRQVRAMGVRLALDDFGTGYSSLSLLQRFPIQRIKIDRAFVQGIAHRSNDRSLVHTIIAMGQSMGLDLVAEGVETVHQLQSLRDLGCDKAQGFLISRPVPAEAMRSTMFALDELTGLALFASDHDNQVGTSPERWLEPVGAGFTAEPTLRPLATRPLG
jgi:diguanylate cyclase (GGDEF)-like protein